MKQNVDIGIFHILRVTLTFPTQSSKTLVHKPLSQGSFDINCIYINLEDVILDWQTEGDYRYMLPPNFFSSELEKVTQP
jgi:hypothetical protein